MADVSPNQPFGTYLWMLLTLCWKYFIQIFPAALGSFISLRFLPAGLSKSKLLTAWLSAWGIGTFAGRGLAEYLEVTNPHISDALMFGMALFGLSIAGAILNEIPTVVHLVREKIFGRSDDGGSNPPLGD